MTNSTNDAPQVMGCYPGQTAKRFVLDDDTMVGESRGGAHDGRLYCTNSQCIKDRTTRECRHTSAVASYLARQDSRGARGRRDD